MIAYKIFLSTDGKHTVQVDTDGGDVDPEAALKIAEDLYDQVKEKYGLKSEQWKDFSNKEPKAAEAPQKADSPTCGIHHRPMVFKPGGISRTTNRPYQGFWSCPERSPDGGYCTYKVPKTQL